MNLKSKKEMKYNLSKMKKRLNDVNIFNISFLHAVNNHYTNAVDICAEQNIGRTTIMYRFDAESFVQGLTMLVDYGEKLFEILEYKNVVGPDCSAQNMIGHIKAGNVNYITDIL